MSSLVCTFALLGLASCGSGGEDLTLSPSDESLSAPADDLASLSEKATVPVVNTVAQTATYLTINGANFGAGKTTPLLWDDFEGGVNGGRIASSPKVGSWKPVNASQTTYTSAQRHSGSKSLYARRTPSAQWANFDVAIPDGKRFYKSFWFRYSSYGSSGQTKLSQIHGSYGVGDYNPGVMTGGMDGSWWATYLALENSGVYRRSNYPTVPSKNSWHHFEAVLKQSDPNVANGSVTIKVDGEVVYQQGAVKTRERSGQRWQLATFFTGLTNFSSATETWIDDTYMNDSWARVELCESPVYSSCTRKEIQPLSSWASNAIKVQLNKGSFKAGETAYLFVVDANGAVNAMGYPLTIN